MAKARIYQGIHPGGSTPTEYVKHIYKIRNIAVAGSIESNTTYTDNSFTLTIPYSVQESLFNKVPYPKSLLDEIQLLYNNTIKGDYGSEAQEKIRTLTVEEFIVFLDTYKFENQITEEIQLVNQNLILKEDSKQSIEVLVRNYQEIKNRILLAYKYFYKTKDSANNIWGYSEVFYRVGSTKNITIASPIDDTTTTAKDGFTLNEVYYLFLCEGNTETPLTYTATSNLALDKGIITINTLSL